MCSKLVLFVTRTHTRQLWQDDVLRQACADLVAFLSNPSPSAVDLGEDMADALIHNILRRILLVLIPWTSEQPGVCRMFLTIVTMKGPASFVPVRFLPPYCSRLQYLARAVALYEIQERALQTEDIPDRQAYCT